MIVITLTSQLTLKSSSAQDLRSIEVARSNLKSSNSKWLKRGWQIKLARCVDNNFLTSLTS